MSARLLSKSRYMNGLQCLKLLWLTVHEPGKLPVPDLATQHIFDQGHLVGELAKKLFPDGIEIPTDDFMGNLKTTRALLEQRKPLFEAGFMVKGLYARLDILSPHEDGGWDIFEVKSSTGVKPENLHDISFQKYCCEKQGLEIHKCYLVCINNQYVKHGEIDPRLLFKFEDITEEVKEASRGIEERIAPMIETLASKACPEVLVGEHCHQPYECAVSLCWDELPEHNIFSLYRGGKKAAELFNQGILFLKDIPPQVKLTRVQEIQKECDINSCPHIEKAPITEFLRALEYPLHYLDFETFAVAIPLFDGTRPYQKIPFQYSLHIDNGSASLQHFSYLSDGPADPRPELLKHLQAEIYPFGSVMTYNQSFEKGVLDSLARDFPVCNGWAGEICNRVADLIFPFRNFHYYHPEQSGSASIKNVLPALTGMSYSGMPIADGEAASCAYLDMIYSDMDEQEKNMIRVDLEKYCGLDTAAMVEIVKRLREL